MISIEEAQRIVLENFPPLPLEEVPLLDGLGRVIGEEVRAPRDIPPADNSAMDGYAFSLAALRGDFLKVSGFLPAGGEGTATVAAGEAVKIMTGAPIPPGCDTVVPVEEVQEAGNGIRLLGKCKVGAHIRSRGEEIREGERAIAAGTVLRPQEIGLLASFGRSSANVYRRARVAILATGDELCDAGSPIPHGGIVNSNTPSVASQVLEAGGVPVLLGIAPDTPEATRAKIAEGAGADVLVTTGGVSVGDRDYVKDAIVALGGRILFWKVAMKPGKPVAFAVLDGRPVIALPGNPAAAMVGFEIFLRPAMLRMMGHSRIFRPVVRAVLSESVRNRGDRPHLVRVRVTSENGAYAAATTGDQGSARLSSLTNGNGLIRVAPGAALVPGDAVDVLLLDRGFEMRQVP